MDAVNTIPPINPLDTGRSSEPKVASEASVNMLTILDDGVFELDGTEGQPDIGAPNAESSLEGLDISALVALISKEFILQMGEQRDMSRSARNSSREQMVQASLHAVEEMKKAALMTFAGKIASSAATIVAGAASIGSSARVMSGLSSGKMSTDAAHAVNNRTTGLNQIVSSVGEIASSTTEMIATTEHTAAQTNLETQSSVHRLEAEDSAEYFRDAMAIIREAQSTLQAFHAGMSEARSEIIKNARI